MTMTRQKEWCGDIIEISLQVEKCQIWWHSVATIVEICGQFVCQTIMVVIMVVVAMVVVAMMFMVP